jgi:hypothetical protein
MLYILNLQESSYHIGLKKSLSQQAACTFNSDSLTIFVLEEAREASTPTRVLFSGSKLSSLPLLTLAILLVRWPALCPALL